MDDARDFTEESPPHPDTDEISRNMLACKLGVRDISAEPRSNQMRVAGWTTSASTP
jgi:hypothetical protein